jgi:hypothetical protein
MPDGMHHADVRYVESLSPGHGHPVRRHFALPPEWDFGGSTVVRFDGVDSRFAVFANGGAAGPAPRRRPPAPRHDRQPATGTATPFRPRGSHRLPAPRTGPHPATRSDPRRRPHDVRT